MPGLLERIYNAKWLIFGVALILLLLWIMQPFLDVFVYAIFLYYITRPIKRWLGKYIKNETLQVLISLLLLALPLILLITYTLLFGISQLMAVNNQYGLTSVLPAGPLANASASITEFQHNLTSGHFSLSDITNQNWYRTISGYSGALTSLKDILLVTGSTIADILFKLFIIFFIAFTLLKDDHHIRSWFSKTFPSLMEEHNGLFPRYMRHVDSDLQKIFFGNLLSIVFFAIIAVIAFNLLNVFAPTPSLQIPAPVLLGILCGVSAMIPFIGMWLVVGPLMIYLLIHSLLAGTLMPNLVYFIFMFLFIFIFVTTLPGFIVGPLIARGDVKTGLLMFAYIIGPLVFGITGIFLGAIVLVLLTHYFNLVLPELTRERKIAGDNAP